MEDAEYYKNSLKIEKERLGIEKANLKVDEERLGFRRDEHRLSILLDHHMDPYKRIIYLPEEITYETFPFVKSSLDLLCEKSEDPVEIAILSRGGDIEAGMALYDTIRSRDNQIITSGYGYVESIAVWVYIAGDKRIAYPNARFMVHKGNFEPERGDAAANLRTAKENLKIEEIGWEILASHTKLTPQKWKKLCANGNFYLSAEEAKKHGLVHKIIKGY